MNKLEITGPAFTVDWSLLEKGDTYSKLLGRTIEKHGVGEMSESQPIRFKEYKQILRGEQKRMGIKRLKLAKLGPQLHTGDTNPRKAGYEIKNDPFFVKPKGGIWTSSFDKKAGSSWMAFCGEEQQDWLRKKGFTCEIDPEARILEIDSLEDLEIVLNKYGMPKSIGEGRIIDYEKIKEDYDGVHLTEGGQWRTRLTMPDNLYGWDVESTIFLRDVFTRCQELDLKPWRKKYLKACKT